MEFIIILGAKYLFALVLLGAIIVGIMLPKERRLSYLVAAIITGIFALIFTKIAGTLYFDPRPFTHGVHALIPHEADNGFPSDHTVLSISAAVISLTANRKYGIGLFALALIVGLCRVLSGIHSPLDILTGILIGLIAAFLGYKISSGFLRPKA